MSEDDLEERTEEPSERRLKESREKGQIARSKDTSHFIMLFFSSLVLFFLSPIFFQEAKVSFKALMNFDSALLKNDDFFQKVLCFSLESFGKITFPWFVFIIIISVIAHSVVGGFIFSSHVLEPKFSRLNPLSGLKKMFSAQGLYEAFKSFLKLFLMVCVLIVLFSIWRHDIERMITLSFESSIIKTNKMFMLGFIFLSSSLAIIAFFDAPFQIFKNMKQLKMTKQEVKEEYKQSEGKPEVKRKIREIQRELSKRKMVEAVPKADVIITNPTHFAVALQYDQEKKKAPILLAKGSDLMAQQLILLGKKHHIPLVSTPALARAIYYSTSIGTEIPEGLYVAVAQILVYVYRLKSYRKQGGEKPKFPHNLPIPEELRRDS